MQEKAKIVFNWKNIFKVAEEIFVVLVFVLIVVFLVGKLSNRLGLNKKNTDQPLSESKASGQNGLQARGEVNVVNNDTNLKSEDLVVGNGNEAKPGSTVTVNYTGTLTDGTKFDSSYDRKQPFSFKLGAGEVIKGWDQGVAGMKVGGKRKLTIPPALGYGAQGSGSVIPPNSTLIFEIELLDVK